MTNIMSSEMPPLESGSGQGPAKKNNGATGCRRESFYIENSQPGMSFFVSLTNIIMKNSEILLHS